MKNLLIIFLLVLCSSVYSQNISDRTVLTNFVLGVDNMKSLSNKLDITELNVYFVYDGNAEVVTATFDNYTYKGKSCKICLLLVNDKLYAVQYYPRNDKKLKKYKELLWTKYNVLEQSQEHSWFNCCIEIKYNIDGNDEKSFIHYDIKLMKKYPQYKTVL